MNNNTNNSSQVGQKASKLRDFLEQQRTPGNLGLSKTLPEPSSANQSRCKPINLNCEHDTEIGSNLVPQLQIQPTITISNPYGYTGTVNDYKTLELKAQVLRAFLKPKIKQTKAVSEMEVWDHVDILEKEELPASYSGNALNSPEELPELNSAITLATELDTVETENEGLRSRMNDILHEKNELTGQVQNHEKKMMANLKDLEISIHAKDAKIIQLEGEIIKLTEQLRQLKQEKSATKDATSLTQFIEKLDKLATQQENHSRQLAAIEKNFKLLHVPKSTFPTPMAPTKDYPLQNDGLISLTSTMDRLVAWIQETTDDIRRANDSTFAILSDENRRLREANLASTQRPSDILDSFSSKTEYETQLQNCVMVLKLIRGTVLKW